MDGYKINVKINYDFSRNKNIVFNNIQNVVIYQLNIFFNAKPRVESSSIIITI